MKIFLDTNVLLDWILARDHAFGKEATIILKNAEVGNYRLFVSSGSLYTLAYVIEKSVKNSAETKRIMSRILAFLEVANCKKEFFEKACISNFEDLEDAFQYFTALSIAKIDYFITANKKDFNHAEKFPVLSPKEFLDFTQKTY
ncbi:MAG TPA: PIN domain-containing protein [Leadbetterella sp.]|nr:PIN domain-containing protein [Leadbetterella sp.]